MNVYTHALFNHLSLVVLASESMSIEAGNRKDRASTNGGTTRKRRDVCVVDEREEMQEVAGVESFASASTESGGLEPVDNGLLREPVSGLAPR